MARTWSKHLLAAWPALLLTVLLAGAWTWIRWGYLPPAPDPAAKSGPFIAWIGLTFLAVTLASVLWTASTRPRSAFEGSAMLVLGRVALLADAGGILLTSVGLAEGLLDWSSVLKLYLLLIAWTALWTACTYALRRWGPGVSVGVSVLCASIFFAGPVLFVPAVRAVGRLEAGEAEKPWQSRTVATLAAFCPLMAALDALHPRIQMNWATLPGMYAMSGLGQDIPMELPPWWVSTAAYGFGSLAFAGIARAVGGGRA